MVSIHSGGCNQLQAPVILERVREGWRELLGKRDSECIVILGSNQEHPLSGWR